MQFEHMQAKKKMGNNSDLLHADCKKVALLLSYFSLCPQLGDKTVWFQTCILNMHMFNDLDFSPSNPHPPLYVHLLVWSNDNSSL